MVEQREQANAGILRAHQQPTGAHRAAKEQVGFARCAEAVTYGCMINACVKCSQTEKATVRKGAESEGGESPQFVE